MVRDTFIRGLVAGGVANIGKETVTWTLYWFGLVRYTFVHIAAGYFVPSDFVNNPVSLAAGVIADWTLAGVLGVVITYILRSTGSDYGVIKGAVAGALFYVVIYGALMALDVTRVSLLTPLPNLLLFFPHILFGGIAGWVVERYSRLDRST